MGQCLFTKLMAAVNNDNIPYLGELKCFHVTAGTITDGETEQKIRILNSKACKVFVHGDGYISSTFAGLETNRLQSLDIPANTETSFYVANLTFDISITECYTLKFITLEVSNGHKNIVGVNLNELGVCSSLEALLLTRSSSTGSLDGISSITTFSSPKALTMISTTINGSIESFVAGQVAAGSVSRLDNSFGVSALLNGHTTFENYTQTAATNAGILQWDGASRIFLFSGSATDIGNCTHVYEKGATAEEIAAWRAAGKTVVDVVTLDVYTPTN